MHRMLSLVLTVALVAGAVPPVSASGSASGRISGSAWTASGQHLTGQVARVRSLDSGRVAGLTTTGASGEFLFTGLGIGTYVVELVANGAVVGTSAAVALTDAHLIADGVSATAAAAQAQTAALAGSFWTSTAGIITLAAITAGIVAAVVVARDDASPSR